MSVVPQTPSPLLIRLAAHPPDSIAVVDRGRDANELRRAGAPIRGGGRRRSRPEGCGPGWAVAFLVEPGARFVETLVAIWRAGGIAVPLSPLHTAPELAHLVQDAAPRVLVASAALAPRLAGLVSPTTGATTGPEFLRAEDLTTFSGDAGGDFLPLALPTTDGDGDGDGAAAGDALMLYTSGTTGRPKGVRLTHAALAATVTSLEQAWRWRRDDRLLHVLPLHHTHGLIVALLGALWAGAETRFMAVRRRRASGPRSRTPACSWRCRRSTRS